MYMDPTKIRSHTVKLRLNDDEHKLIESMVKKNGGQKAVLLRDILLEQAEEIINEHTSKNKQAV